MKVLVYSLVLFGLAFIIHFVIWKIRLPKKQRKTILQISYIFFHDEHQKAHIANQASLYSNTPIGLGRFIQRSNLKKMYRRFARYESSEVLAP